MSDELLHNDFTDHKMLGSPTSTLAGSFSEEHEKMYHFHQFRTQKDRRMSFATGEKILSDVMNWFEKK